MGKKVKSEKPAVVPATVEELSETIQRKKENAKLLEKQMKLMTAKVLATIDVKQTAKAVEALKAFKQRQNAQSKGLLDSAESSISMSFTMTALPETPSHRPQLIKIPHPFTTKEENSRVCIFVKDPARAFKDQIEDLDIPVIAKVIGYDKLKRNFKQYKDKRQLLKDYDSFLADLRVYKMLPEVLGKEFYASKKYPAPIKVHDFQPK